MLYARVIFSCLMRIRSGTVTSTHHAPPDPGWGSYQFGSPQKLETAWGTPSGNTIERTETHDTENKPAARTTRTIVVGSSRDIKVACVPGFQGTTYLIPRASYSAPRSQIITAQKRVRPENKKIYIPYAQE